MSSPVPDRLDRPTLEELGDRDDSIVVAVHPDGTIDRVAVVRLEDYDPRALLDQLEEDERDAAAEDLADWHRDLAAWED